MKNLIKIFVLSVFTFTLTFAQSKVTVTVKENQTIRQIADEYLGDSNLWEDILRANNLSSPAEIKTGVKLTIPVASIKENQDALNSAFTAINEASKVGAKLFAEELINSANKVYEDALTKRKEGKREESTKLAKQAKDEADKAIIESQKKSNTSGRALLSYKKGDVENRKPSELIWNDAELYAKLFEQYRTRTLSNSYAEISFKDLSKIRLYENSQAVIQSSRVDLLKNQRKASVNLEKGEAYALLLGNGKKKDFNFNIPGIDTKINSKLFWVQKENRETKIANYNGEISVTALDSMVVIRENEGSVVPDDGVPSEPKSLLPPPGLLEPEFEKTFFVSNVNFKWSEIEGAVKYSFMVSGDKSFDTVIDADKNLTGTEYTVKDLKEGIYFWRVSAIDEIGFPGPFSQNGFFVIREDKTPPYLIVKSPADEIVTKQNSINIIGVTENQCTLFINNTEVKIDTSGNFNFTYNLSEGFNTINIKSIDLGKNETVITKNVIYESNPNVDISFTSINNFDESENIISSSKSINIFGKTRAKSTVKVGTQKGINILKTFADEKGDFEFLISNISIESDYLLSVETPAGYKGEKEFHVILNSTEPEIKFYNLPRSTSKRNLEIKGTTENVNELLINKSKVTIDKNNFTHIIELQNDINKISFELKNGFTSRIIEREILLDTEAPVIINKNIKTESAKNFDINRISITVSDKSNLKRTAEVEYEINGNIEKAYLRLTGQTNIYEGNIQILKSQRSGYRLKSITLEDYLGNKETYNL